MQRVLQAQTLAGLRRRVVIRDFIRLQRVDHIEDANAGLEITTGQRGWIGAPVDSAVVRLVTERTVANGIGSAPLGVFLQLDLQQIGRETCRERVGRHVYITVAAV